MDDGYRYLLTCIDVLSKYAWVVPLKNKSGEVVAKAFQLVLTSSGRYCQKLHTDKGKEFYKSKFRAMLKQYDIEHFSSGNKEIKCSVMERFNRTLKPECIDISLEPERSLGKVVRWSLPHQ